jgi:hypothetical protein
MAIAEIEAIKNPSEVGPEGFVFLLNTGGEPASRISTIKTGESV